MDRLPIVGAGGHGRSVAEAVAAGQYSLAGFVDDTAPSLSYVWEWPVFGTMAGLAGYRQHADVAVDAIGNNRLREELHRSLDAAGFRLATVIYPKAIVSPRIMTGAGSVIMAGSIIGTEVQLGVGVIVNCGAVVDHHCRTDDFGHLGVNAGMAGGSVLSRGTWMQAGSVLGSGIKIDAGLVLEAGEAVSEARSRNAIQ